MDLVYKKVVPSDREQTLRLIESVIKGLKDPDFFIPYEQWELDSLFDDKNYAVLYGAYDGNKLVAIMQLYVNPDMVDDLKKELGLAKYKVCELGGALVLPEYRGRGVAIKLGLLCVNLAKESGFDYVVAAAHPENRSSWASIEREVDCVKETVLPNGFYRKLYIKKLN